MRHPLKVIVFKARAWQTTRCGSNINSLRSVCGFGGATKSKRLTPRAKNGKIFRQTIIQPSDGDFQLNFMAFGKKLRRLMNNSAQAAQTISLMRKKQAFG
ncbi:hypothetical protein ACT7BJ_002620 [Cronobacter turicensis]